MSSVSCAPSVAVCEALEPRRLLAINGLNAIYFNNADFTGSTYSRIDKSVGFSWPNHSSPAPGIAGTTFSARWHGLVKPYTSETCTFVTKNNDGVRLWVNGRLLINSWKTQGRFTRLGSIALKANRAYDIRLEHFTGSISSGSMSLSWKTPTRAEGRIPSTRFFAYDTRGANVGDFGFDNAAEASVARMIKKWKPDYVTTVGDNNQLNVDGWSNFDRVVGKHYREFIGNYKGSYGLGASTNKFFPAMGNHDWDGNTDQVYKDYFTLPNNERYYDVRKGPIHFFIASSDPREPDGTSASSKQAQWIKSKMLASTAPFKVVIFHHPAYSSGDQGDNAYMRWPLTQWGADVVLSGHDHFYERLSVGGIPAIINGAGGTLTGLGDIDSHSIVRNNADHGALLISANSFAMTLQYQHDSGKVIDTITIGPTPASSSSTAAASAPIAAAAAPAAAVAPATPVTSRPVFSSMRVGPLPFWSPADDESEIIA